MTSNPPMPLVVDDEAGPKMFNIKEIANIDIKLLGISHLKYFV